jgi:ABC-type phosphate transport system substrate-binding protein
MKTAFRRRGVAGIATASGVVALSISLAAGGTAAMASAPVTPPPGNNIIIGSGSATAYNLMVSLDDLFNSSQGCDEIASGTQTQSLNYNCAAGAAGAVGLEPQYGENPLNDVALQEPPLGGSNGLKQLEGQVPVLCTPSAAKCTSSESINFATTVRTPLPSDPTGLNFVNYAKDAISWFHFTEVDGKATASAAVKDLSIPELADIWNGTYTNWDQIPKAGGKNAPIALYVTNSGSGLLSLWNTYLGENTQTYVLGLKDAATHVIEQNEDASIIKNGDEANAIFFFSRGRFEQTCAVVCGGTPVPGAGKSTSVLGNIDSIPLTTANILNGTWPTEVFLSNVYSNGANSTIPAATQATLNYASEDGFLCKTQISAKGNQILDPLTNKWYRNEIKDLIVADGFVPLPLGAEGTVDKPAVLKSPYSGYDSKGTNPKGYCRVTTTNGNA